MATINYQVSIFTNGLSEGQLHVEITNNELITAALLGIDTIDDLVTVTFDRELTEQERSALDQIVSVHTPNSELNFFGTVQMSGHIYDFEGTYYTALIPLIWVGPPTFNQIHAVYVISHMNSAGNSYQLRLYDVQNHKTIAEGTYKNNDEQICQLNNINNIPQNPTQLELQAKTETGTLINVKSLSVYYS